MNNLIQTLCKNFVDDWEVRSSKAHFCLRFPHLANFIIYIEQNCNLVQKKRIFDHPNINTILQTLLIDEINGRISRYIDKQQAA